MVRRCGERLSERSPSRCDPLPYYRARQAMATPFGGAAVNSKPPEKGSFPLDREGQVRAGWGQGGEPGDVLKHSERSWSKQGACSGMLRGRRSPALSLKRRQDVPDPHPPPQRVTAAVSRGRHLSSSFRARLAGHILKYLSLHSICLFHPSSWSCNTVPGASPTVPGLHRWEPQRLCG